MPIKVTKKKVKTVAKTVKTVVFGGYIDGGSLLSEHQWCGVWGGGCECAGGGGGRVKG